MQTQKFTNLKNNVKNTISDVETWVNSLGHQIKFSKSEALNNFKETKRELILASLELKNNVENIESYTTQKKDQVVGELLKLKSLLDKEVTQQVEEFESYKAEVIGTIDNINENFSGEVDERVKDDLNSFRFVASDIKLRLNTLRLFFIDGQRKDELVAGLEEKRLQVKSNIDNFKQKLVNATEEAKNDLSVIENGVKEDYKKLENYINKLSI